MIDNQVHTTKKRFIGNSFIFSLHKRSSNRFLLTILLRDKVMAKIDNINTRRLFIIDITSPINVTKAM